MSALSLKVSTLPPEFVKLRVSKMADPNTTRTFRHYPSTNKKTLRSSRSEMFFRCSLCFRVRFISLQKHFEPYGILNFMTTSNFQAWNKKYILLNNSGGKDSLVMKFGQFIKYKLASFCKANWTVWPVFVKQEFASKNWAKSVCWRVVPGLLCL